MVDEDFVDRLDVGEDHWVSRLGRWGYLARSIVWAIIGIFFVQAGINYDPDKANGLSAALQTLAGDGWGQGLLWVVALGLLAFGLFTLGEARYRKAA